MAILSYVLCFLFCLAGLAKLLGAKPIAEQFEEFGLPRIMMTLVGLLEIVGAIGLLLTGVSFYASIGLAILMLGAVANHLKVRHPFSKVAPSVVLLLLLSFLILQNLNS